MTGEGSIMPCERLAERTQSFPRPPKDKRFEWALFLVGVSSGKRVGVSVRTRHRRGSMPISPNTLPSTWAVWSSGVTKGMIRHN